MSRPDYTDINNGSAAWDATVNDNYDQLRSSFPFPQYADFTDLATSLPVAQNEGCAAAIISPAWTPYWCDGTVWAPWPSFSVALHAATHENGGLDEINVAGLSGVLADAQTAAAHAHASHTGLLTDDHTQYFLNAGRAGGQTSIGGTAPADEWVQRASSDAALGTIRMQSPLVFDDVSPGSPDVITYSPTYTEAVAHIGGVLNASPTITVATPTFIWASWTDLSSFIQNSSLGFSATTIMNALMSFQDGTFDTLLNCLVLNCGVTHRRTSAGTSTVANVSGLSFSPRMGATVPGAVMTRTDAFGVRVSPTWDTSTATSTVNLGRICGMQMLDPAQALFGNSLGTEIMTSYWGVACSAMTFPATDSVAVIKSDMVDGVNRYLILNPGGARSDFGGGNLFNCGFLQILADNISLSLGAAGGDVQLNWNGSALEYDFLSGDDLRWSAGTNSHTLQSANFGTASELRMGFDRFAFGQTGSVGNQVGIFVAPARTATIGGGWSDFLLTQAGNITLDAAMSQVSGWTINAPSIVLGTGSVVDAMALLVGGSVTQGTNRYGMLVLSNPSGGTLNYCARFQGAAGVRIDGTLEHAGSTFGIYGSTPVAQSAAYTRDATVVEDRTLLASASATATNNNNVIAALIADLQATGIIG